MVEKVVRNGIVAVLISPGHGTGWSTCDTNTRHEEFFLFDRGLVELAESGAKVEQVEEYIKKALATDDFCTLGWRKIQILWIPQGLNFRVECYDGHEFALRSEDLVHTA